MTPIRINCTFIGINAALADKFTALQAAGCAGAAHCCHAFRVCQRPQTHRLEVDPAKWRINTSDCASQLAFLTFPHNDHKRLEGSSQNPTSPQLPR